MVVMHWPVEEIAELLRDPSPRVRALAARVAGRLDMAAVRTVLEQLAGNADVDVRREVELALKAITPNGGRGGEIINRHGGYGSLKAHAGAEIAYDATVAFCDRFINRRSRTHDQMVQAARSGKQNIVEASAAAGVSSKTELKLTGVARASLEELLADFQDFLRQRGLARWTKDDPRITEIRKLAYLENRSYSDYRTYIEQKDPETAANAALCLVYQATFLLDRLLKQLETTFIEKGGFSERMYDARLRRRTRSE